MPLSLISQIKKTKTIIEENKNKECIVIKIQVYSPYNIATSILCQKYPCVNTIDICIIDDGIFIPGSFEESNIKVINDSETIFEAINGETTDKEKYALHGRGLNTSVSITTLGYGEEMLIASRDGTCTITKEGVKLWDDLSFIEGTFVTLRANTNKIKNIHNYTKRRLVKKLK